MANLEILLEAEKRGILPPDKKELLTEARNRGLIPPLEQTNNAVPSPEQPQPQPQQPTGIMDTLKKLAGNLPSPLQAASNVPSDLKKTFIDPLLHPIDTVEGVGKFVAGGARKYAGMPGIDSPLPFGQIAKVVVPEEWEKYPDALIQSYIDKYGSLEKAKTTFENEPISFLLDLSTLFTGTGAVLKAPQLGGKAAQVGNVLSKAGKAVEPISATSEVMGGMLKPLKGLVKQTEGSLSGIGATNIEKGIEKVAKGGDANKAFVNAKKGKISKESIYEEAKEGMGEVVKKYEAEYESNLAKISKDKKALDVAPIENKFDSLVENLRGKKTGDPDAPFSFKGTSVTPNEEKLINDMYKRFRDDHVALAGEGGLTPLAINDFKKYVSKFYSESGIKSKSIYEIKSSINEVLNQIPDYEKMQGAYKKALSMEEQFKQAIGNPDKKIADAAVTKLTNTLKSEKEYGINFIETLEKESGKEIIAKLAGLSMQPWMARNAIGKVGQFAAGSAAAILGNPAMAANMAGLFALASPKVVGEFVRAIGTAKRYSTAVKKYTPAEARLAYGQAGKLREQKEE